MLLPNYTIVWYKEFIFREMMKNRLLTLIAARNKRCLALAAKNKHIIGDQDEAEESFFSGLEAFTWFSTNNLAVASTLFKSILKDFRIFNIP